MAEDEKCLCLSLSFSISETKHVIKKLTTHVTVTLEVLINKPTQLLASKHQAQTFSRVFFTFVT